MSPPISIDGTDITGATIDGTDVSEITVDGDVVFTAEQALPTAGLLHRYDASELTGETDGQNISGLPDLAGNDDLSRTGTVEYETNAINGLPALRTFSGGNGIMTGGSVLSQPFAVWYAWEMISTNQGLNQVFANSSGFDVSVTPNDPFNNGNISIRAGNFLPTSNVIVRLQIAGWEFDGSNSQIYDGTTSLVTGDAGTDGTFGGFILFNRRISAGNSVALNARYGEMLIYDMNNPSYNASDVANYLGEKWGVSV